MDNAWNFQSKLSGSRYAGVPLWLGWTVDGAYSATESADPSDVTAQELFRRWAAGLGDHDTVPLRWSVISDEASVLERAPFSDQDSSFLDHFTHPFREGGQVLKWTSLPVLDQAWRPGVQEGPAGFIQEIAGWKPSPLQQTMDVAVLRSAWRI